MTDLLPFAEAVAREAGALLRERFGAPLDVRHKGRIDLVTEVDVLSEQCIRRRIQARFPDHAILAEESGLTETASDFRWIVDPLDGTTNYAHGYPFFSVAIAVEWQGETIVGVVYDPLRDELFSAAKGQGTRCNGRPLHVSGVTSLEQALLVTGFPYNVKASPQKPGSLQCFSGRCAGYPARRIGGTRSGVCGGRAFRWLLGAEPCAVGYGRRQFARYRSWRAGHGFQRAGVQSVCA